MSVTPSVSCFAPGFLVLPSCVFALAVIIAGATLQAAAYSCSRGELEMLEVAGAGRAFSIEGESAGGTKMSFSASQDRYVLDVDVSQEKVFVMARPSALFRNMSFMAGADGEVMDSADSFMILKLSGQKFPRIATVGVEGPLPSQKSRNYSVRFAPKHRLPQLLVVSDGAGFRRCLAWGALTGSQISIPPSVGPELNISVLFSDFVLGVPYDQERSPSGIEAADATWTVFSAETEPPCQSQCPGCISPSRAAYHGVVLNRKHSAVLIQG